jgi:hypothetical protein
MTESYASMPPHRKLWHLSKRFMGQLSRRPPSADDDAWAVSWLLPAEQEVWWRMKPADRRHAVGVARHAHALLDGDVSRAEMAGIVLHDCGKVDTGLGPFGRTAAMVKSFIVGRSRAERGDGQLARYLRHEPIGAAMLSSLGSDPVTVSLVTRGDDAPRRARDALQAADDA